MGFPGGSVVKNLLAMQETQVCSLDQEDHLEEGVAIHCNILAWRIPQTEEPGGLQSMGSQRVSDTTEATEHTAHTCTHAHTHTHTHTIPTKVIFLYILPPIHTKLRAQWWQTLCDPVECSLPGKNPGVGCHFPLQSISLTQGSNPGLLH